MALRALSTTVAAVARRPCVPVPAVCRRWANRVEIIESAIVPRENVALAEPTGDLLADLQAFVDVHSSMFATPAARAGFLGLLSEYGRPRPIEPPSPCTGRSRSNRRSGAAPSRELTQIGSHFA
jgi:hypothetical protein